MRRLLAASVVAAALLAGCGQEEFDVPIERDLDSVEQSGTTIPYERGSADGSGADGDSGDRNAAPRGGVAAGPDSSEEGGLR